MKTRLYQRLPRNEADVLPRRRFAGLSALTLGIVQFGLGTGLALAQELTWSYPLRAGWNAVYLELAPTNDTPGAVFAGLPIESVWTFRERLSAVDYIQDPSEPVWNKSRWSVYLPTNRVESFHNTLFRMQAQRAYLVNLTNSATLTVTGRPSWRRIAWAPNAYNLCGFAIDPAAPPTFLEFFRPSAAHYNTASGQLERIYQLGANGQWTPAGLGDPLRHGEAYWVYCRGESDYGGPLELSLTVGDGLDYGAFLDQIALGVKNRAGDAMNVTLADGFAPTALSYMQLDTVEGPQWLNLPSPLTVAVAAGEDKTVRLAIRRNAFTAEQYASALAINNSAGMQYWLPVRAQKIQAAQGQGQSLRRASLGGGRRAIASRASPVAWCHRWACGWGIFRSTRSMK